MGEGLPGAAPLVPPSAGPLGCPRLQQRLRRFEAAGGKPGPLSTSEAFQTLPGPLVINENLNILLPGREPGLWKAGGKHSCELGSHHGVKSAASALPRECGVSSQRSAAPELPPRAQCLKARARGSEAGPVRLLPQGPYVPGPGDARQGPYAGGKADGGQMCTGNTLIPTGKCCRERPASQEYTTLGWQSFCKKPDGEYFRLWRP